MALRHPTILVGYGAYGRHVLKGLLTSAAARGMLAWEEPAGGASTGARRIEGLVMLWVPDHAAPGDAERDDRSTDAAGADDVLSDLFLHIEEVGTAADAVEPFREAVERARATLLDGRHHHARGRLRFGLDVIIVARPDQAALGRLERMLNPAMADLANSPNLAAPPGQGAQLLNFVQIFDFDHFWDSSAPARALRSDVKKWIAHFSDAGSPTIGRIYLMDGKAAEAEHDSRWREEEAALFLEFLLFEGLRGIADLGGFYQGSARDKRAIAAVGIRAIERSTGLLSRLAAAHFATGWLDYLATRETPPPGAAGLRTLLDTCRPESLEADLDRAAFVQIADRQLQRLETELLQVPMRSRTWVDDLDRLARRGLRVIRRALLDEARERADDIAKRRLHPVRNGLVTQVTAALHDPVAAEPLAGVLREVERVEQALLEHDSTSDGPAVEPEAPLLDDLRTVHNRYMLERLATVDVDGLRWLWPLLAVVFAAALTPALLEAIGEWYPPDPASLLLVRRTIELLFRVASPVTVGLALFTVFWLVGWRLFQPRIAGRIERALDFFTNRERGRLANSLRAAFSSGPIRLAARTQTVEVFRETAFRLRSAMRRELAEVASALRERRREMIWLRQQMSEYLRIHGVDTDARGRLQLVPGRRAAVRTFIETDQSLDDILQANPPNNDHYREEQTRLQVFDGWREEYCDTFLYPQLLIDRISASYEATVDKKMLSGDDEERKRLADGLGAQLQATLERQFQTSFSWAQSSVRAVPVTETYCVLPDPWAKLPGIEQTLRNGNCQRIVHMTASDRAYVLRLQENIDPEWLT